MADTQARWVVPGKAPQPTPQAPARPGAPTATLNVLMVVPTIPYPPVWGFGQRCFQLARHLAQHHRVTIVCYAVPDQRPDLEDLAEHVHEAVAVVHPHVSKVSRRLNQVRCLLSRMPFHAAGLRTRALQSTVDELLATGKYDVVLLESSQMAWLQVPDGVPIVIDEHNIESELLERMAQSEHSRLRRSFYQVEFTRYHRFESEMWGRSAGCAATSHRDASMLYTRCPDVPVAVVPNGVDVDQFTPAGATPVPNRLVFTGLLDYRPNYDGISWFLDEVYPIVRRRRPEVQLQVVGHGSPEVLEALRRPSVEVTGRVPDLRANLDEAAIVVVPLRIGGGTRLKVVEAMSMGKAIVSTTLGAEGIDVVHEEDVLLADDPVGFADAVCSLLDDPETRQRLGANARKLAAEHYSWQRSSDQLSALLQRVVGPAGSSPTVRTQHR